MTQTTLVLGTFHVPVLNALLLSLIFRISNQAVSLCVRLTLSIFLNHYIISSLLTILSCNAVKPEIINNNKKIIRVPTDKAMDEFILVSTRQHLIEV